MSGGTPVGGGFMRQRHSQGYTSGSDDHEDDACSRASPQSPSSLQQKTRRRWVEIMENVLWIASAVFIIYCGDRHSNFIVILWHDDRIRRRRNSLLFVHRAALLEAAKARLRLLKKACPRLKFQPFIKEEALVSIHNMDDG